MRMIKSINLNDVPGSQEKRKLVLHFDVRNTVLVADSISNIDVEQSLNSYLTSVTWGTENKEGGWKFYNSTPCLKAPAPGLITYYKYQEKKLVRTPSDRELLRKITGDFTFSGNGNKFNRIFDQHLSFMEWKYPTVDKKLTMKGQDDTLYHYLLPSFIGLIEYLHKENRDFSIIIRTYGLDADNVLSCLDYSLKGNHPLIEEPIPIKVNKIHGHVTRSEEDHIQFEVKSSTKDDGTNITEIYANEKSICDMLNSNQGIYGFKDDFRFWQMNDYHHTAGKPFWIDPYNDEVHHIFFDDNIRVFDEDSIVNVRLVNSDGITSRNISLAEQKELENVCLVQSDLLASTADIEYFIKKVHLCEKKYSEYLKK